MSQNLYLVGFMGCGKTRVGRLLARRLKRPFVDLDEQFAREHDGVTAGEYIRTQGEPAFRAEEQRLLERLVKVHDFTVFSTGGGDSLAQRYGAPLLARLPIDPRFMAACDNGDPGKALEQAPQIRTALENVVRAIN